MDTITINGLFSIIGFIVGLIAVTVLFGIIKRTKDAIRHGFIFVLVGMVAFILLEAFKVFEVFLIIPQTIVADVFAVVFVLFLVVGMWKLKTLQNRKCNKRKKIVETFK